MRKATLFVLVAGATMSFLVPSAAARGSRAFFGVVQGQEFSARDYTQMRKAGTGTVRFGLTWAAVQPTATGGYHWNAYDERIGRLAAHGIRPFPTLSGSPPWAARKAKRPPLDSKQARQGWRQFLAAAVNRYGRGGTFWRTVYPVQHPGATKHPITEWQIWNEPNLPKFFPKRHATRRYAQLVKLSDKPIHDADPKAELVLAGMPAKAKPSAHKFLGRLYRVKGFKRSFDATALHPYAVNIKQFVRSIKRMRRTLKQHNDRGKPLWLTEVGWGSMRRHGELNMGKQGQKRLLKRSFRVALHKRHRWRIEGVQWFKWRDSAPGQDTDCSFCRSAGLLKYDYSKKPAYRAFRQFARRN